MKLLLATLALTALLAVPATAASVDTRLSTREAYVGSPVTFQIAITNAADYEQPTIPSIDGCDVRTVGTPSQSSQITIINGRRRESRSVTIQYQITPRREGTFTIPALNLKVDGETFTTEPKRFVATRSETGDLMFIEVEGDQDQVFVGQPLDLTLKIWLKPFRDPESGLTLSEGDMWNMISGSSSWGGFTTRMKEMSENRQRPGGEEVLRDDGNGNQRAYYLYEIDGTVYPQQAGQIDASDVEIVVNYPLALGRRRSPLSGMLDDDFFGSRSPMSRMMNEDFFGSPFGDRLVVTESRPILGDVSVDATEVLPVPTQGRPADYRGAVGRYQMVTRATPASVDAGDPITLSMGIVGDGPMELVQAPPLYEMPELTADFKVADEPLAGFVQDDTKVFTTTIRPRRAGITEIPPIRFSFFNPDTEEFETVHSDPISITVNPSETLALDAIVGHPGSSPPDSAESNADRNLPDFSNHSGTGVLVSQAPRSPWNGLFVALIAPPIVWLLLAVAMYRQRIVHLLPSFRSAKSRYLASIQSAKDSDAIDDAIVTYLFRRLPGHDARHTRLTSDEAESTPASRTGEAIGRLRIAGLYQLAAEVESFLSTIHQNPELSNPDPHAPHQNATLWRQIDEATGLIEQIDDAVRVKRKTRIRRPKPRRTAKSTLKHATTLLLALTLTASASEGSAADLHLSGTQRATILDEANTAYAKGIEKSESDSAESKEHFATAMEKYQQLVASGIRNTELFTNLGNASMQSGQLGRAIANYEKALRMDSTNTQARRNLAFANQSLRTTDDEASTESPWSLTLPVTMRPAVKWIVALAWLLFWGLLILRLVSHRFPVWKCAAVPLVIVLLGGGALWESSRRFQRSFNAVIVADHVSLHVSDGEQFDSVVTMEEAQGHRVTQLSTRGDWSEIRTAEGHTGWVPRRDVERVDSESVAKPRQR